MTRLHPGRPSLRLGRYCALGAHGFPQNGGAHIGSPGASSSELRIIPADPATRELQ